MFNSKFNTLLTVLLIVAIVAIIGIIGYFGYSIYNKYYINAGAKNVIDAFEEATGNTVQTPENEIVDGNVTIGGVSEGETNNQSSNNTSTTTYYGYNVIGTISIPAISIEYPILEKVTTKSLKVAVAYLSGVRNKSSRKYSNTRT